MSTRESSAHEPAKDAGKDEIQADIDRTREHLGQTVEALSDKFDVKGRARHKVADVRETVVDQASAARAKGSDLAAKAKDAATDHEGNVKPVVPSAAVVVLGLVVLAAVRWRRRQ
jgi:hypothetical protein